MGTRKRARSFWRRHRTVLRAWGVFLGVYGALHTLVQRQADAVAELLLEPTAQATAWTLALLGANGRADGRFVVSDVFSVEIILECTGIFPALLFAAAVMAHPCGWQPKLLGLALGIPILALVNLLRVVSLCYVGHWFPSAFDATHLLVWQSLNVFITVLLWSLWAIAVAGQDARQAA